MPKKGYKQSEEHRNRINNYIQKRKGKTYVEIFGEKKSKEMKLKLSNSHKGKKHKLESRLKMGRKGLFKGLSYEEKYGKEKANKIKLKMSKKKKGKSPVNKGKTYEQQYGIVTANKLRIQISNKLKGNIPWTKGKTWEKQLGKKIAEKRKKEWKKRRNTFIIPLKDSKPELLMQNILDKLNIDYEKHRYIKNIKHGYQCDIFIEPNTVIEVDGVYWHNYPYGREIDTIRTEELINNGYQIFRFWEGKFDFNFVKNKLLKVIDNGKSAKKRETD